MKTVKLGIVGLGRLGRNHAANIHYHIPNAELTAICSVIPQELEQVGQEMQPKYRYTDYREMFLNKELDGVVIATNSQLHCEMACAAAELGVKNVYMEKPLGMTIEEIDRSCRRAGSCTTSGSGHGWRSCPGRPAGASSSTRR